MGIIQFERKLERINECQKFGAVFFLVPSARRLSFFLSSMFHQPLSRPAVEKESASCNTRPTEKPFPLDDIKILFISK